MNLPSLYETGVRYVVEGHLDPLRLAEECRGAALDFTNGVRDGWGRRELGAWLSRDYRHATRWGRLRRSSAHAETAVPPSIDADDVRRSLREARWSVLAELESISYQDTRPDFVDWCLMHALVVPCMSENGSCGWTAVDYTHVRLRDRVLALFAVDYLVRPRTYADLSVCHYCERVAFAECPCRARALGLLGTYARTQH